MTLHNFLDVLLTRFYFLNASLTLAILAAPLSVKVLSFRLRILRLLLDANASAKAEMPTCVIPFCGI